MFYRAHFKKKFKHKLITNLAADLGQFWPYFLFNVSPRHRFSSCLKTPLWSFLSQRGQQVLQLTRPVVVHERQLVGQTLEDGGGELRTVPHDHLWRDTEAG